MGHGDEPGDYDNWTWEQIETAICGGVDMSVDEQLAVSKEVSDPDSLNIAAGYFYKTRTTLQNTYDKLKASTDRIVGVKGKWQGAGADSFRTMMDGMLGTLESYIATLSEPSYFTTLIDAGNDLQRAINEVVAADSEGAHEALQRISFIPGINEHTTFRDVNGTRIVPVALFPDIVDKMTTRMRAAIKTLAAAYQKHGADLRDPGQTALGVPSTKGKDDGKFTLPNVEKPPLTDLNLNGLTGPKTLTNLGLDGNLELPPNALTTNNLHLDPLTTNNLHLDSLTTNNLPADSLTVNIPPPDSLTANLLTANVIGHHGPPDLFSTVHPPDPNLDKLHFDPITHLSGTNSLLNNHAPGLTSLTVDNHLTTPTLNFDLNGQQQPPGNHTLGNLMPPGLLGLLSRTSNLPYRDVRSGVIRGTPPVLQTTNLVNTGPNYLTTPNTVRQPNFITGKDLFTNTVVSTGGPQQSPTVPGMIGRRNQHEEDEWTTSLVEDEDPWTEGTTLNPSFLTTSE